MEKVTRYFRGRLNVRTSSLQAEKGLVSPRKERLRNFFYHAFVTRTCNQRSQLRRNFEFLILTPRLYDCHPFPRTALVSVAPSLIPAKWPNVTAIRISNSLVVHFPRSLPAYGFPFVFSKSLINYIYVRACVRAGGRTCVCVLYLHNIDRMNIFNNPLGECWSI